MMVIDPASQDLVSLVIPVYNQLHYTKQCLDSIRRSTPPRYEIIVVDNGSLDGTREYLASQDARVITNAVNLGCAKAWNQGVLASRGQIIGILNNDIVVTPGWLENLIQFMDRTGHGIVSPSAREGRLDYDLDRYALDFVRACGRAVAACGDRGDRAVRGHARRARTGDPGRRRGGDRSARDRSDDRGDRARARAPRRRDECLRRRVAGARRRRRGPRGGVVRGARRTPRALLAGDSRAAPAAMRTAAQAAGRRAPIHVGAVRAT